jgi:hypothetical protein
MFSAGRNYLHHLLLKYGLKQRTVVIVIYSITAISASICVLILTSKGKYSTGLLLGELLLLFSIFACLHRGRLIFAPNRRLLILRLLDFGLNHPTASNVIYALTVFLTSIVLLILTIDNAWLIYLLVGLLILQFSIFIHFNMDKLSRLFSSLMRNYYMIKQARSEMHILENARAQIRKASSFDTWWNEMCNITKQMRFRNIELQKRQDDDYVTIRRWNSESTQFPVSKIMKLRSQFTGKSGSEWEIRAEIDADDAETCGRQCMLITRLIDESPPPEWKESVIQVAADSSQGISDSASGYQSLLPPRCVTFDESVPDRKIGKFLDDVTKAVKAATTSQPHFDDEGAN